MIKESYYYYYHDHTAARSSSGRVARIRRPQLQQSIDRANYLLSAAPTAAKLQQRVCCSGPMLEHKRTDTKPFHRSTSAYYAGSVNTIDIRSVAAISSEWWGDGEWSPQRGPEAEPLVRGAAV